ncbi:MAG: hypothetical protein AAF225_07505, partial [Pseudomonadota bacterium]
MSRQNFDPNDVYASQTDEANSGGASQSSDAGAIDADLADPTPAEAWRSAPQVAPPVTNPATSEAPATEVQGDFGDEF